MIPSELPVAANSAPTPWRQKLGRSTLLHGLLGALIAYPVMLASIVLSMAIAFFSVVVFKSLRLDSSLFDALSFILLFLGLGVLPAMLGALIYFGRSWLLREKPRPSGVLVYALACFLTPLVCVAVYSLFSNMANLVAAELQSSIANLYVPVTGFIAGVLCIQIEKRVNKSW